jgi:hypothetical protein
MKMDVISKFNNLTYNKQKYKFHDSSLLQVNIDFENKEVKLIIEFCRYLSKSEGDLLNIEFLFKNTSNIQLRNDLNKFGIADDINSFIVKQEKMNIFFSISGYFGWEISFAADDFTYKENVKERLIF